MQATNCANGGDADTLEGLTAAEIVDDARSSFVPVVVNRTSANITTSNVGFFTWTAIDPDGNPTARPMDLVFADVQAGDWFALSASGLWQSDTDGVQMTVATVVAGANVNYYAGLLTTGVPSWGAPATAGAAVSLVSGTVWFRIVAGDIEAGSVRFRWVYWAGAARTLNATSGIPLQLAGQGPFR